MLNVQFLNFRCFTRSSPVEIRPITLLIGENSTGKSSFLAGLRFIFEAFSGGSQNIFNKEPFFLGGFEEIAHRRPRRLAPQFEMKVNSQEDKTAHHFIFTKGEPQPELSEYKFIWSDHDCVSFSLIDERPTVTFAFSDIPDGVVPIDLFDSERGFPPSAFLRANLPYLRMLIDQMRFRAKAASHGIAGQNLPKLPEERIAKLEEKFHRSVRHLQKNVFASAPVRTQPSRTYIHPIRSKGVVRRGSGTIGARAG
jgi:hypothetical protein